MFNFLIKKQINKALFNYKKIVVWGLGGLGKSAIANWLPMDKIEYIVDNNIKNKGKKFYNIDCYPTNKIRNKKPELIVVCSSAYLEIFEYLKINSVNCKYFYIYELFLINIDRQNQLYNLYIDIVATKNCNIFKLLIVKPQVIVNITYRLSKILKKYKILFIFYWILAFIHYIVCMLLSIQLPLEVDAGPGLIFAHPGSIVFSKKVKMGAFVSIYHCCTLGTTLSGDSPTIKDFVTIYTGSHVLGNSILDSHSRIGAMSLLLNFKGKKYSTVAGIPAKLKRKFLI